MRVLFATSIDTWGGGEEWMLSAALDLASRGHAVCLLGRPRCAIVDRARRAGLDTHATGFRSDADLLSTFRAYRLCRSRRIEALVLNMDRVLRTAGLGARLAGVPVILPRRGSEFPLKPGPLYRWTYRSLATGVLVNSEATARALVADIDWRPRGGVRVLPNGVDHERFATAAPRAVTRASLGVPAEAFLMVAVGELTGRKNLALLLEAMARLDRTAPEPWLVVAGDGAERESLVRRASAPDLAGRVRFLGFRDDVPDLLGAADLLVHPSRVEGFGYAVAEAMAAGLPVVATDASSLPEIVTPGTGILFEPENAESLAAAISAYARDPVRRAEDGARGRERVRAEFSRERRNRELEDILAESIAAAGSRSL